MTPNQIKHGTTSAYRRHGCRCTVCRDAARAFDREYWRRRGRQPIGNPCEADGKTFPTQREAAKALGVSKSAVTAALNRHGDLSRIGKGRGHSKGGRKNPVKIGPREWPSRKALAEYLGTTPDAVRGWIRRGNQDRLIAELMKADARHAEAARTAKRAA